MSALRCIGIAKRFGPHAVLDRVDLELQPGKVHVLLGQSGSGKTTLARILCGLLSPDAGRLEGCGSEDVMLMPQDFVVFPHLTVRQNVAVGGRCQIREPSRVVPRPDGPRGLLSRLLRRASGTGNTAMAAVGARPRSDDWPTDLENWLDTLGLRAWADSSVAALSFGQQQRVALARAFYYRPRVLILDEPLAHLDTAQRRGLAQELAVLCRASQLASLWITHEAREAFAVADSIAVLEEGRIQQLAAPEVVYREPASPAIACLTGACNLLSLSEWDQFSRLVEGTVSAPSSSARLVGFRPESVMVLPASHHVGVRFSRCTQVEGGFLCWLDLPGGKSVCVFTSQPVELNSCHALQIHPQFRLWQFFV
jgi:iron(III) transport system ATP-binding protein